MTRVSIALATYNGERFLAQQLASLANQTRLPDELIVGDDGSSDGTIAILEKFAESAPFAMTITINPGNLGYARNFTEIVRRSNGDIIFFCDQDDIWHADKIEKVLQQFNGQQQRPWLISHDANIVEESGASLGLTLGDQARAAGEKAEHAIIFGCCMAINRPLTAFFDNLPADCGHDGWAAMIADMLVLRRHIDIPLIDYRRHGENLTHSYLAAKRKGGKIARFQKRLAAARTEPVQISLQHSIALYDALLAALKQHEAMCCEAASELRFYAVSDSVQARLEKDTHRLQVHQAKGFRKLQLLIRNLVKGHYRGFDGQLSLLRDLLG